MAVASTSKEHWKHYDTKNSPFLELKTPFTAREAAKMAFFLPWLLPRIVLGVLSLTLLAIMSFFAALGWPLEEPMPPWRRKVVTASANCAGFVLLMLGFRIRVKGWENVAKAKQLGAIGLFNHSSWVDAVLIMFLFAPSGVSKESNAHLPLIGMCIRSFQNIYVSRGSIEREKRKAGTESVSDKIAKRAKDRRFPMLFMAPEGTCGDGRCILRFRTGAFVPGVPVLPVAIAYNKRSHNPAWTIMNEGWHFVRMCCQFDNAVDVVILPPYVPSEEEKASPALYAKNVQQLYAKTLDLPIVNQSQEEFRALVSKGVAVSWDGRKIIAPAGVIDGNGFIDLTVGVLKKLS
ncbi:g10944 [Coccomyxa elongata]